MAIYLLVQPSAKYLIIILTSSSIISKLWVSNKENGKEHIMIYRRCTTVQINRGSLVTGWGQQCGNNPYLTEMCLFLRYNWASISYPCIQISGICVNHLFSIGGTCHDGSGGWNLQLTYSYIPLLRSTDLEFSRTHELTGQEVISYHPGSVLFNLGGLDCARL